MRHPAYRYPEKKDHIAVHCPRRAGVKTLMYFLCKLNRLLESLLCCGLCGAGKESQPFSTVSIAMTEMWDFNILPLRCHQRKEEPISEASPEGEVPRLSRKSAPRFSLEGPEDRAEGRKLTLSPQRVCLWPVVNKERKGVIGF